MGRKRENEEGGREGGMCEGGRESETEMGRKMVNEKEGGRDVGGREGE